MKYQYIQYQKGKLAYLKFGKGDQLLIALHGFSDRAMLFENLEASLSEKYTVCAIDFPFHGKTDWEADFFDKKDILAFIKNILEQEKKTTFSLMGYSMGGRVAQVILPEVLHQLEHLYLIAPDGIRTKWMFDVNQMPFFIRRVLQKSLQRPATFFKLLKWLLDKGLLTKFLHDFAYNHIKTPERRQRLFCTWASIYYFQFDPKKIKKLLQESELPTNLYFGKRDEVIPPSIGEWLAEDVKNIQLYLLEEGHLLIDQELNTLLDNQLNETINL